MAKHTTCDVCGVSCSRDYYHIQVRSSDQTTLNVNKHLCRVCSELMVDVLEHPSECMMPKRLKGSSKNG